VRGTEEGMNPLSWRIVARVQRPERRVACVVNTLGSSMGQRTRSSQRHTCGDVVWFNNGTGWTGNDTRTATGEGGSKHTGFVMEFKKKKSFFQDCWNSSQKLHDESRGGGL
jgi:hypothetical protein